MPLQQFDERAIVWQSHQFTDVATPGAWVTTAGAVVGDYRLDTLQAVNDDTIDHIVGVDWINGNGTTLAGSVTVPAGAGIGAVPPVDLLAAILPAGLHYMYLINSGNVGLAVMEAINTGKHVTITGQGGSF